MTEKYDFDVLYIGAGHGTFDGAIPLANTGCKVGVIESGLIGGTCPNRGCNAKITLDEPVSVSRAVERLDELQGNVMINWPNSLRHKQAVIDPLPDMIAGLMTGAGIKIIKGHAVFQNSHTVIVDDGQTVTADKIVISTGLRPHRLAIPGDELAHDSEDFMNLTAMPTDIVIMGAGYISMEFATIANAAGAKVTVLLHHDKALRNFHQPFVEKVIANLEERGVTFVKNVQVQSIEQNGADLRVTCAPNQQLSTKWVLDATGRIPNVENIGLDTIGVEYNANGVVVNDHLQTTVDNVYASGDVLAKTQPKLTPTAIFESTYLCKLFSDQTTAPIDYPAIPTVTFTSPRIAEVGMSVEEAAAKGYTIKDADLTQDWYYQVANEKLAECKLIYNPAGQLVGATEVSDRAQDVINTLLPVIALQLSPDQLGRLVSLFPSIGSDVLGRL